MLLAAAPPGAMALASAAGGAAVASVVVVLLLDSVEAGLLQALIPSASALAAVISSHRLANRVMRMFSR
jgi:hypothetical protein